MNIVFFTFFVAASTAANGEYASSPPIIKCPPGFSGQLPYQWDCRQFINCWEGSGTLQFCGPGTLFSPEAYQCDYAGRVFCSGYPHYGYAIPHPAYPHFDGKSQGTNSEIKYPPQEHPSHHRPGHHKHHSWFPGGDSAPQASRQDPQERSYESPFRSSGHSGVQPPVKSSQPYNPNSFSNGPSQNFNTRTSESFEPPPSWSQPLIFPPVPRREMKAPTPPTWVPIVPVQRSASFSPRDAITFPSSQFSPLPQTRKFEPQQQNDFSDQVFEKCPEGFSGLLPHPECWKFLSCSGGRTFVMTCGAGTGFSKKHLVCDHSDKLTCHNPKVKNVPETTTLRATTIPTTIRYTTQRTTIPTPRTYPTTTTTTTTTTAASPLSSTENFGDLDEAFWRFGGDAEVEESAPRAWTAEPPIKRMDENIDSREDERRNTTDEAYKPHPENRAVKGFFIKPTQPSKGVHSIATEKTSTGQNVEHPNIISGYASVRTRHDQVASTTSTTPAPPFPEAKYLRFGEVTTTSKPEQLITPASLMQGPPPPKTHVFRPKIEKSSEEISYGGEVIFGRQAARLRGGPSVHEGFVEIQLGHGSWGMVCDEGRSWSKEEADVVCKTLGFKRGSARSYHGYPPKLNETLYSVPHESAARCRGGDSSTLECSMTGASQCSLRNSVWVRCIPDSRSQCLPGEVQYGSNCYSLIVPKEEEKETEQVAYNQAEALAYCRSRGGHLLDISSQAENDFVSEWLVGKGFKGNVMTAGVGMTLMGNSLWIWEGREEAFKFQNWWPGWKGNSASAPKPAPRRALCIIAKRMFPCSDRADLCDTEYYYWDTVDCAEMEILHPFVCERPVSKIGCTLTNGAHYKGHANVTKYGKFCLPWDSDEVFDLIGEKIPSKKHREELKSHNFCRNLGGFLKSPWCFVRDNDEVKIEECDIPHCFEDVDKSLRHYEGKCKTPYSFYCHNGPECIPKSWVCDSQPDCSNRLDEMICSLVDETFVKIPNSRLIGNVVETYTDTSVQVCAQYCHASKEFQCSSFSFSQNRKECQLNNATKETGGFLKEDETDWTFYELKPDPHSCQGKFLCENDHCVDQSRVCDGSNDCGDSSDERNCDWQREPLEVRLSGGVSPSEGIVEIKVFGKWGLLCGKDFGLEEADVICRQAGYPMGALEALKAPPHSKSRSNFHVSDLECSGSEPHVGHCQHLGWERHNCTSSQAVGVVCKELVKVCSEEEWKCMESENCIPKKALCDGVPDCPDGSDEEKAKCSTCKGENCSALSSGSCTLQGKPVTIRLVGGQVPNEGTIEVKVQGKWGLICGQDFDIEDGNVICRQLGFPLGAANVQRSSRFGTALHKGNYLLSNLSCTGMESCVTDCNHPGLKKHSCPYGQVAAVACKVMEVPCPESEWSCTTSRECINIKFMCDGISDCKDGSDEDDDRCNAPVKVRLVGTSRGVFTTKGRVEVQKFGVWGTVCDDDFGEDEAKVVCRGLGMDGPVKVFKEAAFGPGEGPIWLDQVHCSGRENRVDDCMHESWGQTNCKHNEDVSVSCSPGNFSSEVTADSGDSKTTLGLADILPKQCGRTSVNLQSLSSAFRPRVVYGFETVKGAHPWQAGIRVKSTTGRSNHWCGAVLLSKLHVLTAAHCVKDYVKAHYFIRAGDYDNQVPEDSEQDLEVEDIWIHEKMDEDVRLNNDIALIRVKDPGFTFTNWVSPICLPPKDVDYYPGKNCTVTGWGSHGAPGSGFARILHASWIGMMDTNECRAPQVYGESAISEGMFCAGDLSGGPDTCQGDSGGPFLCSHDGSETLFGITSWGHGCGRENRPGVYTKITHYLDWILDKVQKSIFKP